MENEDPRTPQSLLMRQAIKEMVDDYMTSEKHHPDYVLVPVSAFEKARDALFGKLFLPNQK